MTTVKQFLQELGVVFSAIVFVLVAAAGVGMLAGFAFAVARAVAGLLS